MSEHPRQSAPTDSPVSTLPRPATRKWCALRSSTTGAHTLNKAGTRCTYCGSHNIVTESGYWTVQHYNAAGFYTLAGALSVHRTESAARAACDALYRDGVNAVDRFVSAR